MSKWKFASNKFASDKFASDRFAGPGGVAVVRPLSRYVGRVLSQTTIMARIVSAPTQSLRRVS